MGCNNFGSALESEGLENDRERRTWCEPNYLEPKSVLDDAKKVIAGERQDTHGDAENSFPVIAAYWQTYILEKIRQQCRPDLAVCAIDLVINTLKKKGLLVDVDAVNMLVLFKQARKLGQKPNRDNYVDSCGYEAIAADRLIKWEETGE